jgi:hypothetical protein
MLFIMMKLHVLLSLLVVIIVVYEKSESMSLCPGPLPKMTKVDILIFNF